ncbi:hypothetical protein DKX38_019889 [Salix brachista]|uniref:DUF4283 domain-containing protein n=1 Tax=Salix brachista TaxID=2182728 RepID=A0A5N5KHR1_9ROSI|nr:hypothetical protein DKX38_019889 [Salix brachista]
MATRKDAKNQPQKGISTAGTQANRHDNLPARATVQKGPSWADKVRVSDSSTRFKLQQLAKQPVGSRLVIPPETLLETTEQWTRSMVGFFPGYKMPFHAARSIARRAWDSHGLEQVMTMDAGFLIFRFKSEAAMQEVLAKGPWMFGGKHIALQQWHPQVQFERNKMRTMPVWVRIYGLPFPLWSTEGLSRAASMIGMPLSCDEATYNGTRLDYARLCVEIAAEEEFVHKFEMESSLSTTPITIRVEYEWKPARCSQCKVFGHNCQKQGNHGGQDAQGCEEGLGEEGTLNPQETVPKTTPLPQPSYLLTKNNGKQPLISIPQLEEDRQSTVGNVNLAPKNQSHKTTNEAKHISMAPSSSQTPTNLPNLPKTPQENPNPSKVQSTHRQEGSKGLKPQVQTDKLKSLSGMAGNENKMVSLHSRSSENMEGENTEITSAHRETPTVTLDISPSQANTAKKKGGKKKKGVKYL